MTDLTKAVVFRIDEQRYALPVAAVERIVRAAEVAPLPGAPSIVLGALRVEDRILPVLNIRRRFGLPEREITPADHFLIGHTGARRFVLVIDEPLDVIEAHPSAIIAANEIVLGLEHVQGVAILDDGLIVIHDLQKFLSVDEAHSLEEAMASRNDA